MRRIDRQFFGGYFLTDTPGVLFGFRPLHPVDCGCIGGRQLLHACLSQMLLNDEPGGLRQESADMAVGIVEAFLGLPEFEDWLFHDGPVPSSIIPYSRKKLDVLLDAGMTPIEAVEAIGIILHPDYLGRWFFEHVEPVYPVEWTETTDEEGNMTKSPSHWARNPEV